jgi:hypothetical protein
VNQKSAIVGALLVNPRYDLGIVFGYELSAHSHHPIQRPVNRIEAVDPLDVGAGAVNRDGGDELVRVATGE